MCGPAPPVRQIARQYWQPDEETSRCSMADCDTVFTVWGVSKRRHHCRQCGRVVCGACSRGQRFLQLGDKKQGRKVRVCNACLRTSETFEFDQPQLTKSPSMAALFSKSPVLPSSPASWAEGTLSAADTPPLLDHHDVLHQLVEREEGTGQKRSDDRPIGVDARLAHCDVYQGMTIHEPAAIKELLRLLAIDVNVE